MNLMNIFSFNKPVILSGRISEREDRDTEIICEKVEVILESAKNIQKSAKKISHPVQRFGVVLHLYS